MIPYIEITRKGAVRKTRRQNIWDGTALVGTITVSYARLIRVFGEPTSEGDWIKMDACWEILTPEGPATIYNWKDGGNYLGDGGLAVEDIEEWHIGGFSPEVIPWIIDALHISPSSAVYAHITPIAQT